MEASPSHQQQQRVARLADELRGVPLFARGGEQERRWVAERGTEVRLESGQIIATQGDPADGFCIVLEGETAWARRVGGQEVHAVTLGAGSIFAELILLLDAPYPTTGRTLTPVRLLKLEPETFWAMLSACPSILREIVRTAVERSQIHESVSQQEAKLISLGSMAAGLAHELNNPAAAVTRAASDLRTSVGQLSPRAFVIGERLDAGQLATVVALRDELLASPSVDLDPLARSDLEDEVGSWLDERGLEDAWDLAAVLVEVGTAPGRLDELAGRVPVEALGDVLAWLQAEAVGAGLADQVEQGATRISRLVGAVKEYSYMDRAKEQDVDLHDGLESTLVILGHKLRDVTVVREYDRSLPPVPAHGSELNQVWTNLIDNAVGAMDGRGTVWLRTWRETDRVVVEVADEGPGIPADVLPRIWEPFFTTKGVGSGTGLGLDIARRIVVGQHGGDIRVDSQPGDTRFQVRLPLGRPATGPERPSA